MLARGQLDEFAEHGFLVLPQVVPAEVVAAASRAIDQLVEHDPPGPQVRGPHNYFLQAKQAPALAALLARSPAFGLAEALTGPGTLAAPWQVQVALNIPPFGHRPGMGHIDGFPPEPDGRPGTFTMLAGVLMSGQREQDTGNLWVWPGTHLTHARYFRARWRTTYWAITSAYWAITSAATPRRRSGARSTSGSSDPGTMPGGGSSSRIPGWTTTRSAIGLDQTALAGNK